MKSCIRAAFEILKRAYGTHTSAARSLDLTPEHYRALRNGRAHIPARTAEYIMFKAQEAATLPGDEPEEARKSA